MSTKAEIDQVLRQMQQGVRKMTPLVAEQQPERDRVELPKPAMVVRERWSRSSRQERMEQRVIEMALEEGKSMEEIEEILAEMKRYSLGMITKEEKQKRLEMLEDIQCMLDRWDEEDVAKKSLEEETLVADDSGLSQVKGSLKSFCSLVEPMFERKNELADDHQVASQKTHNGETLICWDQKLEPYFERGKDAREKLLEAKKEKCAHHVFNQMAERVVRATKKRKRWKKLILDIEKHLEDTLSYEGSDNFEMLGIQIEDTSKRQRKQVLEWCKGVSCRWIHTRQRLDRKWMLMFRKKKRKKKRKRKRRTEIAESYRSYSRSERWMEIKKEMLRNMIRYGHCHVKYSAAEKKNKEAIVEMKTHNSQELRRRLLLLNLTEKNKKKTRLEKQEKNLTKAKKYGDHSGNLRETKNEKDKWVNGRKSKYRPWKVYLEGEQWLQLKRLVLQTRKLRGAKSRYVGVIRGRFLLRGTTMWMKSSRKMGMKQPCTSRKRVKFREQVSQGISLIWLQMKTELTEDTFNEHFKRQFGDPEFQMKRRLKETKIGKEVKCSRCSRDSLGIWLNCSEKWGSQHELKVWDPGSVRFERNQWRHVVERVVTTMASGKPVYLLLQRNGGYKQVVSCEWDLGGVGSCQTDRIERVGTDEDTLLLDLYWETKLLRPTTHAIRATDRGTMGRVSGSDKVLLFENLMKVSSEIHKGINFRVMLLYKDTKTFTTFDSWMRGRLTLIINSEDTIKEASRDEFRTGPFEKHKLSIFSCDWLHSPRPPELLLCSSCQIAIRNCRGMALWITMEDIMVEKVEREISQHERVKLRSDNMEHPLANLISCLCRDGERYGWKLLGAVDVSLQQLVSAFDGGSESVKLGFKEREKRRVEAKVISMPISDYPYLLACVPGSGNMKTRNLQLLQTGIEWVRDKERKRIFFTSVWKILPSTFISQTQSNKTMKPMCLFHLVKSGNFR